MKLRENSIERGRLHDQVVNALSLNNSSNPGSDEEKLSKLSFRSFHAILISNLLRFA
jgi:hypothetical protein